ncbi:MAG: OB-fold nucleic acid binding domain-containing protein [Euryarchaeota archaeon]|nr:OB-fold nucleic acid binding domain-containing protein [Euryarchaeota archaeon]
MQGNNDVPKDVKNVYERLTTRISEEEFAKRVNEKVEHMSGLCDEKTAALLVAHELGVDATMQIASIDGQIRTVAFVGRLTRTSPIREFTRDGEVGYVSNLVVSDETGSIRVVLWNDLAKHAEELEVGQTLRISGTVREGPYGIEVNAREVEVDTSVANQDTGVAKDKDRIADLMVGLSGVDISGVVLEVGPVRTFSRRDGSVGKVASISIGDQTGTIRVTLWDTMADKASDFSRGDVLKITDGYTRERYGKLEVHVGDRGAIEKGTEHIEFTEKITPISDVQIGVPCTVEGIIDDVGSVREFTRNNGSTGKVRNIVLRDDTGEIRAALWGEKATVIDEEHRGRRIVARDCMPKSGLNNQLELSIDWRSGLCFLGESADITTREQSGHTPPRESTDVAITGTVISATEAVCVDNGTDYVAFDKEFSDLPLNVGDEVTVIGSNMNDMFTARGISKPAQDLMLRKCAAIKQRCAAFSSTATPS